MRWDEVRVRTYGDARSPDGKVLACEATVRRARDFVDPADQPDITTQPVSQTNLTHGRKFEIISFRWLNASEV